MKKQVIDKTTNIIEYYDTQKEAVEYLINCSNESGESIFNLKDDIIFKNETLMNIDLFFTEAMKLKGEKISVESFISIIKEFGFVKNINPYNWILNDIVLTKQTKRGYYIIKLTKNNKELARMEYVNGFIFNDKLKKMIRSYI
ncbi:hypothetical protein D3C75_186520 [compost metagenome]